jgi:hypothetical protein
MTAAKFISSLFVLLGCFIAAHLYNVYVVILDPCRYHNEDIKTGRLFDLFFTLNANSGYHPEPTAFNLILTSAIGILLGIWICCRYLWTKAK